MIISDGASSIYSYIIEDVVREIKKKKRMKKRKKELMNLLNIFNVNDCGRWVSNGCKCSVGENNSGAFQRRRRN